ncbi:MAG: hypothetical protein P0S94_05550 [Simkaniaceae bacterium]|nr:hypothetical protein [Simkaniaceae bacterium]
MGFQRVRSQSVVEGLSRCSTPDMTKELGRVSPIDGSISRVSSDLFSQNVAEVRAVLSSKEFKALKTNEIQDVYQAEIDGCNDLGQLLELYQKIDGALSAIKCFFIAHSPESSEDEGFAVIGDDTSVEKIRVLSDEIGFIKAELDNKLIVLKQTNVKRSVRNCGGQIKRDELGKELDKAGQMRGCVELNKQVTQRFHRDVRERAATFSVAVIGKVFVTGDDSVEMVRQVDEMMPRCPGFARQSGYRVMQNAFSNVIPDAIVQAGIDSLKSDKSIAQLLEMQYPGCSLQGRVSSNEGVFVLDIDEDGKIHVMRTLDVHYFVETEGGQMSFADLSYDAYLVFEPDSATKTYVLVDSSIEKEDKEKVQTAAGAHVFEGCSDKMSLATELLLSRMEAVQSNLDASAKEMMTAESLEVGLKKKGQGAHKFKEYDVSDGFYYDLIERQPFYESVKVNDQSFSFEGRRLEGKKEGVLKEMLEAMDKTTAENVILQNAVMQATAVMTTEAVTRGFLNDKITRCVALQFYDTAMATLIPEGNKSTIEMIVDEQGSVEIDAHISCELKIPINEGMKAFIDIDVDSHFVMQKKGDEYHIADLEIKVA